MSDDKEEEQGRVSGAAGEEGEEERPRITLDRYMGQRRPSTWSWVHLGLLVFMLAALVTLISYKERCGRAVSTMIFLHGPDRGVPVKIQLQSKPEKPEKPEKPDPRGP